MIFVGAIIGSLIGLGIHVHQIARPYFRISDFEVTPCEIVNVENLGLTFCEKCYTRGCYENKYPCYRVEVQFDDDTGAKRQGLFHIDVSHYTKNSSQTADPRCSYFYCSDSERNNIIHVDSWADKMSSIMNNPNSIDDLDFYLDRNEKWTGTCFYDPSDYAHVLLTKGRISQYSYARVISGIVIPVLIVVLGIPLACCFVLGTSR